MYFTSQNEGRNTGWGISIKPESLEDLSSKQTTSIEELGGCSGGRSGRREAIIITQL